MAMELGIDSSRTFTSRSPATYGGHFSLPPLCKERRRRGSRPHQSWQTHAWRQTLACRNLKHLSAHRSSASTNQVARNSEDEPTFMLINEKIRETLMRRYKVYEDQTLGIEEIQIESVSHLSTKKGSSRESGGVSLPANIPQLLRDFFLPTDFPDSVSHDYLQYMIWQFPTNVTGWACSTLVTSSLLKAVGLEAWAGTTVAATAAIKWVSKDGLGAFGRLFIGGRFGRVFDDDPKQWRMYAEFIGSFGSVFELVTPIKPEWFLPLAAVGRLTKAVGRGLKDPSFRVIQNHFAIAGNMGEVSAKEEVWEVCAELIGIAFGVALLYSPGLVASYSALVLTWASIRGLHLWLRYQSLASLQFSTINFKRAFIMAEAHVIDTPMPGVSKCNIMENILFPWQFSKPYLHLGCSLRDAVDVPVSKPELEEILGLFSDELHVLILKSHPLHKVDMHFIFKEGATNMTVLRCIWQAEWIMNSLVPEGSLLSSMLSMPTSWTLSNQLSMLANSLKELRGSFGDFLLQMEQAGWETSRLVLKIPKDAPYLTVTSRIKDVNKRNQ
eukprot:c22564_g1_i1 orf=226-1887(-)